MVTAWARIASGRARVTVVALVAFILGATAATADAAPTRRVTIETEPSGATVYVGEKEAGSAGVTPVVLDLPAGENVVILELDGYVPKFETVSVPKGKGKAIKVSFELELGHGTLVVEADARAKGAKVLIDDEERGVAPARFDVRPGSHRVEVVAKGKAIFTDTVDISPGVETVVSARGSRSGGKRPKRDGDEPAEGKAAPREPDDADAPRRADAARGKDEVGFRGDRVEARGGGEGGGVAATAQPPMLHVAPLVEVGYRYLEYSATNTPANTPSLSERGAVLLGLSIEAQPLRRLPNLTFTAAGGYGVPQRLTTSQGPADSIWWRAEGTASYRLPLGSRWGVVALVGYSFARYKFFGTTEVRALVPDASYSMARLGAGVSARLGSLELLGMVENRPILGGGRFADRFRNASADGLAARVCASARLGGRYFARLDGSFARYAWSFDYDVADTYRAGGASDVLLVAGFSAGASF